MNYLLRGPKPLASYVGASCDKSINIQSASGGVVSQIIVNHLINGGVVITPQFDQESLRFRITEINHPEDYKVAASVYHDVALAEELKRIQICSNNVYLITCLPCEASFAKSFFKSNNAQVIIVALACSGQQDYAATTTLLKMSGLKRDKILDFKYRGDGWPSGVQVRLRDGKIRTFLNLKGLWYDLFNSQLFTLEKCFTCTDVLGKNADIVCADPWLPEYISSSKTDVSYTLIFFRKMINPELLNNITLEEISIDRAVLSQRYTIDRKEKQLANVRLVRHFLNLRAHMIPLITSTSLFVKLFRILYSKLWKFIP